VSRLYDWSRFRRYLEPAAVTTSIDPDEEPTRRIPVESSEDLVARPVTRTAEELDAELLQHADAGGA
jgi:hypothetical protein